VRRARFRTNTIAIGSPANAPSLDRAVRLRRSGTKSSRNHYAKSRSTRRAICRSTSSGRRALMIESENLRPALSVDLPPRENPLRHTLRYFRRFGWKGGMQAARVHGRSSAPIALRLPGITHPLWVRPGTSDVATFDEVYLGDEYDLPFADFSPRHILDLGANVGYASVYFSNRWPEAAILAVEPAAENVVLLKRNTGAYPRIDVLHAAVWSRPADVAIANPGADANAFRMTEAADGGPRVRAFTIAQLIAQLGCERLDLLKMDVEGAEAEILRGSADWLDRVNVMMIELHDRLVPGCGEALSAALHGRKFRLEIVGQNLAIDLRSAMRGSELSDAAVA
jgi:FkbM family methyltransferase